MGGHFFSGSEDTPDVLRNGKVEHTAEAAPEANGKPIVTNIIGKVRYGGAVLFAYSVAVPVMLATQGLLIATCRNRQEQADRIEDAVNGVLGTIVTRILGDQPHDH